MINADLAYHGGAELQIATAEDETLSTNWAQDQLSDRIDIEQLQQGILVEVRSDDRPAQQRVNAQQCFHDPKALGNCLDSATSSENEECRTMGSNFLIQIFGDVGLESFIGMLCDECFRRLGTGWLIGRPGRVPPAERPIRPCGISPRRDQGCRRSRSRVRPQRIGL